MDQGFHTFGKGISPKVNVMAWVKFELAVWFLIYYTTETASFMFVDNFYYTSTSFYYFC